VYEAALETAIQATSRDLRVFAVGAIVGAVGVAKFALLVVIDADSGDADELA
jgi:hypothetical protein